MTKKYGIINFMFNLKPVLYVLTQTFQLNKATYIAQRDIEQGRCFYS